MPGDVQVAIACDQIILCFGTVEDARAGRALLHYLIDQHQASDAENLSPLGSRKQDAHYKIKAKVADENQSERDIYDMIKVDGCIMHQLAVARREGTMQLSIIMCSTRGSDEMFKRLTEMKAKPEYALLEKKKAILRRNFSEQNLGSALQDQATTYTNTPTVLTTHFANPVLPAPFPTVEHISSHAESLARRQSSSSQSSGSKRRYADIMADEKVDDEMDGSGVETGEGEEGSSRYIVDGVTSEAKVGNWIGTWAEGVSMDDGERERKRYKSMQNLSADARSKIVKKDKARKPPRLSLMNSNSLNLPSTFSASGPVSPIGDYNPLTPHAFELTLPTPSFAPRIPSPLSAGFAVPSIRIEGAEEAGGSNEAVKGKGKGKAKEVAEIAGEGKGGQEDEVKRGDVIGKGTEGEVAEGVKKIQPPSFDFYPAHMAFPFPTEKSDPPIPESEYDFHPLSFFEWWKSESGYDMAVGGGSSQGASNTGLAVHWPRGLARGFMAHEGAKDESEELGGGADLLAAIGKVGMGWK